MRTLGAAAFALLAAAGPQAQDDAVRARVARLIQTLGDDSKEVREKAVTDLVEIGKPAMEALRKATESADAEVKSLARQAIERIEWGQGMDRLRSFVKERFEDGASPDPVKLKAFPKWFPSARFYEVTEAAPAGGAAGMRGMPRSILAVRKEDPGLYRVFVKGIFSGNALQELLRREGIVLKEHDEALDFATSFMELYWYASTMGGVSYSGGMASRFERTEEGWELQSPNYGTYFLFRVDKDGALTDVVSSSRYYAQSSAQQKLAEEKMRLEVEKLRMELEVLRRQLEELKRPK